MRSSFRASQHEATGLRPAKGSESGVVDIAGAPPELAGFTFGEPLGQGGFAVVWAAVRDADQAEVALKIGHRASPDGVDRFRRELDALERVGPPHAARVLGHGSLADGRPYMVLERLRGATLAAELAAMTSPPEAAWAAALALEILRTLDAAHAAGVIHRDLKPSNVFVTRPDGRVVLIDFGLARPVTLTRNEESTRAGVVVGTPEYMAPEQIRGDREIDARADIYAFGALLFELLTLRTPFVGEGPALERGHLALRPTRPSEIAPVPEALEELTLACLAKDPDSRPRLPEIRRALEEAIGAPSQPASSLGPGSQAPGSLGPGSLAPGSLAPGSQAPGSLAPGSRAPGSRAPGSLAPGSLAPGRLVGEGAQAVVLLVADAPGSAGSGAAIAAAVSGHRGFVTRRRAARYVGVFSGRDLEDPARAALAAARAMVDRHGARVALHLAQVTLRPKLGGPPAVYGAAIERPEAWLPEEPWSGVALSPAIARHLGAPPGATPDRGESAPEEGEAPLVGRGDALQTLVGSAAAAFDGTCPGLLTVLGDAGLGKTRFAFEAARAARRAPGGAPGGAPGALVIRLQAAPPAAAEALVPEAAQLLRWVLELDERRSRWRPRTRPRTSARAARRASARRWGPRCGRRSRPRSALRAASRRARGRARASASCRRPRSATGWCGPSPPGCAGARASARWR